MLLYRQTHTYTHIHTHTRTHARTHTHTHIHTHTHTHTHMAGKTFGEAVLLLYCKCNCLLFAIEIVDKDGFSRVVLNPAAYVLPIKSAKVKKNI